MRKPSTTFARLWSSSPITHRPSTTYGLTLFTGGRYADAIEQLRAAISTKPRYARAHITLATVLLKVGETQSACEHLDAARRLEPRQAGIEAMMKRCRQSE